MKQQNYEIGKIGEKLAGEYLTQNGYEIIEMNFHTRHGEIDLIVSKNSKLIFVEVKLKIGIDFGTPEEMITKYKLRQIERTGEMFLLMKPQYEKYYDSFQIDAVCIVMDTNHKVERVNHYEDIS